MPRKLRVDFPGAVYHVNNRGNYRADIFATTGARAAFMRCLGEACKKSGWRLHAYVLMRNHYHLALETPTGNLVEGMQWLQATFANRFNNLRRERGHLFQGRYKALLVEPGEALGHVCHYIHLNPVRAGVVSVPGLKEFRDSSYWQLWHPASRPAYFDVTTALAQAGSLADTPAGRRQYEKFLAWQSTAGPAGRNAAYVSMSRGWALGSQEFKDRLLRDYDPAEESRAWETQGRQEIRQARWAKLLGQALAVLGHTMAELPCPPAAQPWKIALIAFLKESTQVSNAWLEQQFGLTNPVYASRLAGMVRSSSVAAELLAQLRFKCKA